MGDMHRLALPLLVVTLLVACTASNPKGHVASSSSRSRVAITLPEDWQPHSDEALDVSIALPSQWKRDAEATQTPTFRGGLPPATFVISRMEGPFQTISEAVDARNAAAATGYEGQPSIKVEESRTITINGQEAVERREEYLAAGFEVISTYLLNRGQLYIFTMSPDDAEGLPANQISLHQKIMETVQWR